MNNFKGLLAASLSCLVAIVLAGCGGKEPVSREDQQAAAFADLREAVSETVSDERRERDMLLIVDSLERDISELTELLVRRRAELRELNANYDATRAEFLKFTGEMELRIQKGRRTALERRQQLVASLTAEEWASLARAETRAMKSIANTVRGI